MLLSEEISNLWTLRLKQADTGNDKPLRFDLMQFIEVHLIIEISVNT
jgi:hypothetical protein